MGQPNLLHPNDWLPGRVNLMTAVIVWDPNPWIFPPYEFVRWYSLMWMVGLITAWSVLRNLSRGDAQQKIILEVLPNYLLVGIIIGARLGHCLFYEFSHYIRHPWEILPITFHPHFQFTGLYGLASHGGVVGALLGIFWFGRKHKVDFLILLNLLIVPGALLGFFIRIGNLFNSEIIGIPTDLAWGFIFLHRDLIPRHPVQLYEALSYLIIFAVLFRIRNMNWHKGQFFGLGLLLIFALRFLLEFFKVMQTSHPLTSWLSMGQSLSIPFILTGIYLVLLGKDHYC